jgi:hypothetical protein
LGPLLELFKRLLGLSVRADGSMHLFDNAFDLAKCTNTACNATFSLPQEIASTWPSDLSLIELGGINAGLHHNVSVACSIQYELHDHELNSRSSTEMSSAPLIALSYVVRA